MKLNSCLTTTLLIATITLVGSGRALSRPTTYGEEEYMGCPTWYYNKEYTNSTDEEWTRNISIYEECQCGTFMGRTVRCEANSTVRLLVRYCMTYTDEKTIAGSCPYSSVHGKSNQLFVKQPKDAARLNKFTCKRFRRTGPLCSHCCQEDKGVCVLSYRFECARCLGPVRGILLFIAVGFLPATAFVLVVIFCGIRATAPHMNAFVCVVQLLMYSINSSPEVYFGQFKIPIMIICSVLGIWNLDFIRYIYSPFCFSTKLSTMQVTALEYVVSIYPLVLISMLYVAVKYIAILIKHNTDRVNHITTIIHNAFSTFFILGYSKMIFTSYTILARTKMFKEDGSVFQPSNNVSYYTLYNASMPYFGPEHRPYAILASCALLTYNILPVIFLLFHPISTKLCKKLFPNWECKFIGGLAGPFQECYKDGRDNTWNHQYFAGVYLLIRLLTIVPVFFNGIYINVTFVLVPLSVSMLFGVLHPYKDDFYNRLDCIWFGFLTLAEFWIVSSTFIADLHMNFVGVLMVPLVYMLVIATCKLIINFVPNEHVRWMKAILESKAENIKIAIGLRNRQREADHCVNSEDDFNDDADRIQNPENYLQPLLPNANVKSHGSLSHTEIKHMSI